MTRLLQVTAPHFCAGAVWTKERDTWRCTDAAPIIRWMIGKTANQVKHLKTKPGWSLEWAS